DVLFAATDFRWVVAGDAMGELRLMQSAPGAPARKLPLTRTELDARNSFFSPDGAWLALARGPGGTGGTLFVDSATAKVRCELPAPVGAQYCAISTDG